MPIGVKMSRLHENTLKRISSEIPKPTARVVLPLKVKPKPGKKIFKMTEKKRIML